MTEKDYYIERKRLLDRLNVTNARLDELKKNRSLSSQLTLTDDEFRTKAEYFILTQKIKDPKVTNFDKILRKIDKNILKEFSDMIIAKIQVKDGLTTSILFRNGIELRFKYREIV